MLYALNESSRVEKLSVGYMEGIITNRSGKNSNLYCEIYILKIHKEISEYSICL